MEDGVTEIQTLLPPHNLKTEDGSKREDGFVSTGKVEKVKEEDLSEDTGKGCVAKDEDGGGLVKNLISSFVTPLSPRTGKASEIHGNGNNGVFELEEGTAASRGGDRGDQRGGVIDNNGVEGGLISNMISNFFHRSEGEEGVVENEEDKEEEEVIGEKIKRVKTEKEANDGGGSIIHNIVSHLPTSLPASNALFSLDDAVPTADEATILINSIVRD